MFTDEIRKTVAGAAQHIRPDGRRLLAIIPDATRSCPLPLVVRELHAALAPLAKSLDFLIALGTHPPMTDDAIDSLLGIEPGQRPDVLPGSRIFNPTPRPIKTS